MGRNRSRSSLERRQGRLPILEEPEDADYLPGDVRPDPEVYSEFQNTRAWSVVDQAIQGLFENQDIDKRTHTHYIVGYIVKALSDAEILAP